MNLLAYLFSFYPGHEFRWFYQLLILFMVCLAGGIAIDVLMKKNASSIVAKTFAKLPGHLEILSIIGTILILMRIGGIGFFSMRLFLFILLLALALVILNAIRNYFIILPKMAVADTVKKEQDKYLPKRKKKQRKRHR